MCVRQMIGLAFSHSGDTVTPSKDTMVWAPLHEIVRHEVVRHEIVRHEIVRHEIVRHEIVS